MSDPCKIFDGLVIDNNDPIGERLRFNALKNCIPLNVTMELSQDCNFHCGHCYNFDRTSQTKAPEKDKSLSLEQWKKIITQVREAGAFYLCFTGGEILLVPFLGEILRFAKESGASTRIKSNGSLLTREKAKELKELGLDDIEFSLYGGTAATHDQFTGTHGHFEKVLNALDYAKEYKLNPVCNIILHKDSAHEYAKMLGILKKKDIAHQASIDMSIRHDGTRGALDYRMSVDQIETLFKSEEGKTLLPHQNTTGNIQCACARSNCGIGFDGSVYPCIGAPLLAGDILEKPFKEIWETSPTFTRIRNLKLKDYKDCEPCADREFCQRSSGLIYLNTGKYTGSEKQTCDTAAMIKNLNTRI